MLQISVQKPTFIAKKRYVNIFITQAPTSQ